MLRRPALLLAVLLAAPCVTPLAAQDGRTAASPIVFNGLLVQGGVTKVSLSNPTTDETKWVQVGKSYGSYTVGFEPGLPATKQTPATKDTVLLTLGGKVQRIPLQDAPVVTTTIEPSSAVIAQRAALASLNDTLGRVGSDPNTDPRLIQELQTAIQQQQQLLTTGTAARADSFEKTSDQLDAFDAYMSTVTNPDGSATYIMYDANGRVKVINHSPAPDANGVLTSSTLYSAPSPTAPATAPAAAK